MLILKRLLLDILYVLEHKMLPPGFFVGVQCEKSFLDFLKIAPPGKNEQIFCDFTSAAGSEFR